MYKAEMADIIRARVEDQLSLLNQKTLGRERALIAKEALKFPFKYFSTGTSDGLTLLTPYSETRGSNSRMAFFMKNGENIGLIVAKNQLKPTPPKIDKFIFHPDGSQTITSLDSLRNFSLTGKWSQRFFHLVLKNRIATRNEITDLYSHFSPLSDIPEVELDIDVLEAEEILNINPEGKILKRLESEYWLEPLIQQEKEVEEALILTLSKSPRYRWLTCYPNGSIKDSKL